MKKFILKFKNGILKLTLTILGFGLAASQCLAQYMAIMPTKSKMIYGKLTGITDTISRFRIIINNRDTVYTSWKERYYFSLETIFYSFNNEMNKINVEVSEAVSENGQKYLPTAEILAIKPDDNQEAIVEIELEKKH